MKKLSKKERLRRRNEKRRVKKFGHSPYRPRKLTFSEELEFQLNDLRLFVEDVSDLLLKGKFPKPRRRSLVGVVKQNGLFYRLKKPKTVYIPTEFCILINSTFIPLVQMNMGMISSKRGVLVAR